jgi:hypothetical protein
MAEAAAAFLRSDVGHHHRRIPVLSELLMFLCRSQFLIEFFFIPAIS